MGLELPGGENQLFKHSRKFNQGAGKERIGQATVVVSLDGTGDTDDIQEAIDALPSTGGEIYIKEGTYTQKTIIPTKSNVTITGTGEGTILKSKGIDEEIIGIMTNNITIENLSLIATSTNSEGITMYSNKININRNKVNFDGEGAI